MNYTSVEQSKILLELGLSPRTADMFYLEEWVKQGHPIYKEIPEAKKSNYPDDDMPCWSVGALIKLIPTTIVYQDNICHPFFDLCDNTIDYMVGGAIYKSIDGETIIDVCYNMVVWLLENGYKLS